MPTSARNLLGKHKPLQAHVSGGQASKGFNRCNYPELLQSEAVLTFTQPSALLALTTQLSVALKFKCASAGRALEEGRLSQHHGARGS